jgi:hypothetical protein
MPKKCRKCRRNAEEMPKTRQKKFVCVFFFKKLLILKKKNLILFCKKY